MLTDAVSAASETPGVLYGLRRTATETVRIFDPVGYYAQAGLEDCH